MTNKISKHEKCKSDIKNTLDDINSVLDSAGEKNS